MSKLIKRNVVRIPKPNTKKKWKPRSNIETCEVCKKKADLLNTDLYKDMDSISSSDLLDFTNKLELACNLRGYSREYTESWKKNHNVRLFLTIEYIKNITDLTNGSLALEIGEESVVSDLIRDMLPGITWTNSTGDIRKNNNWPSKVFDFILCTEVVEHLSDLPEGYQDTFTKSGLKAALNNLYNTLRPGGQILITTPNAASMTVAMNVLYGGSPWFFDLHIREYTVKELENEVLVAGFEIEDSRTIHCMTMSKRFDFSHIYELMLKNNYHLNNRGDDIFLLARRPKSF